jgi:TIGR03009 family protein
LEYDAIFGEKANAYLRTEGEGKIRFKRPDWGQYEVTTVVEYASPKPPDKKLTKLNNPDLRERWVCDGKAIFQYDFKKKLVTETRLPKEMQGPAIADGPIPFVFGTKADQIKQRYYVRIITPANEKKMHVWLEVWPRRQADAANFERVQVILNTSDFMPYALQMFLPGGKNKTVYKFENISPNSKLSEVLGDFTTPSTPRGWKHVVEEVPSAHKDTQAPAADPASARRPAGDPRR